jgi:hypothetical protein
MNGDDPEGQGWLPRSAQRRSATSPATVLTPPVSLWELAPVSAAFATSVIMD